MATFKGTHGTSAYRANQIFVNGFQPTLMARAGQGVYFWQFYTRVHVARNLAIGWYEFQNKNNAYKGEPPPNKCAVVYGSIDVDESEVLDCTGEVQEQLVELLIGLKDSDVPSYSEVDIHTAYEYLVKAIEKKRGAKVTLVKAHVPPPAKMPFKEKIVIGNPEVIVVRARHNEIAITKLEVM